MVGQEIKVNKEVLEEHIKKLAGIRLSTNEVRTVSEGTVSVGQGHSAKVIKNCLGTTKPMTETLSKLLDNSVMFFRETSTAFKEADQFKEEG